MNEKRMTLEELGELIPCASCEKPTYDRAILPSTSTLLPEGFTAANARYHVTVRGKELTICEACRYGVYGGY